TVVIKDPAGNTVPVTVNPDGTFTATIPAPAPEGAYTVEATDLTGNTGTGTATLDDNVAPEAPEATVSEDGTSVIGRTEPGATVEVKDADGNVIGTGTADANGNFNVPVSPSIDNGEIAEVTAKDAAGNTSQPTEVTGGLDTLAPAAPTDVVVSEDGTTVTGKGEPGSTVEIKDQDGNVIGTGPVD